MCSVLYNNTLLFKSQVSRKLAFVEDELEVAEDRVKSGDAKISELEEELKVTF